MRASGSKQTLLVAMSKVRKTAAVFADSLARKTGGKSDRQAGRQAGKKRQRERERDSARASI